jgi:hypothetical protein
VQKLQFEELEISWDIDRRRVLSVTVEGELNLLSSLTAVQDFEEMALARRPLGLVVDLRKARRRMGPGETDMFATMMSPMRGFTMCPWAFVDNKEHAQIATHREAAMLRVGRLWNSFTSVEAARHWILAVTGQSDDESPRLRDAVSALAAFAIALVCVCDPTPLTVEVYEKAIEPKGVAVA